jgi:hypothetical protein
MAGFSQEDRLNKEIQNNCGSEETSVIDEDRTASYLSDFREKESIEDILSDVDDDGKRKADIGLADRNNSFALGRKR